MRKLPKPTPSPSDRRHGCSHGWFILIKDCHGSSVAHGHWGGAGVRMIATMATVNTEALQLSSAEISSCLDVKGPTPLPMPPPPRTSPLLGQGWFPGGCWAPKNIPMVLGVFFLTIQPILEGKKNKNYIRKGTIDICLPLKTGKFDFSIHQLKKYGVFGSSFR